ncbi:hypothetical protein [Flavobacterium notoginsengisoli]|uniref:hypothetical protein n=1 Tax=Flavobacterium notoginsengisoli TaxID=1478199 RepID=UPI003628CD6C
MEITQIVKLLDQNNFKYTVKKEIITVSLEFSQNVVIDLSDPTKIIISDYLSSWNFLTGCIKMSLKNAFLYNFIGLLFFGFFSQYTAFTNSNLTNLFLLFIAWILLFSTFYLVKLESFKIQFAAMRK